MPRQQPKQKEDGGWRRKAAPAKKPQPWGEGNCRAAEQLSSLIPAPCRAPVPCSEIPAPHAHGHILSLGSYVCALLYVQISVH